ncbi:stage II sporulation protein M [Actinocrinis puniceicyclus]|uniref:Stage II sporulation protein M n=1 Tax=Actinocrinis puniceicyclus TaxID=977794 RepID=A0A8J8BDR7_9ACTN|nr:stage II sporulation protein M [Actinocrinis puniceicyclus]MBS2964446.1 stage II sporulation protein M [Actinocrinis puniceicyclus]
MDIDAFVIRRAPQWNRLDRLARRRKLTVAEVDELLALHQATATDLSLVRSALPDTELIGRLSATLALSRSALTAPRVASWRTVADFFGAKLPAALYRSRWWWGATAVLSLLAALVVGWWLVAHPEVRSALVPSPQVRQLTEPGGDFETYYTSAPARDFAAHVWTNNFWLALETLFSGVLLGIPVLFMLWENVVNLATDGGYMVAAGRGDVFFTLVTPHGLLELTSLFVAAGVGLRLGWTLVDPGPRTRLAALEHEGRTAAVVGIGMVLTLLCSGVIEAFVTPSSLPAWTRIGIGVAVELLFMTYVFVVGRRAYQRGEAGDLDAVDRIDEQPAVA